MRSAITAASFPSLVHDDVLLLRQQPKPHVLVLADDVEPPQQLPPLSLPHPDRDDVLLLRQPWGHVFLSTALTIQPTPPPFSPRLAEICREQNFSASDLVRGVVPPRDTLQNRKLSWQNGTLNPTILKLVDY